MRRLVSILIVMGVLGGFARAYNLRNADMQSPAAAAPADEEEGETKMVDLAADIVYPYDLGEDSSVICLVGNFIGHHNGAVITCDSAVRYGDQRLECFGNVLINKNETYIYGDRADYNGVTNRAEVYSPLVKVIDGDATLYTFRFRFDTKKNIGEFAGGGVVINGENMMESDRGFYYADTREVIGVEEVEIRNETYQMTGDSVVYNIETDNARFFTSTNIWNDKGEYLYADRGDYDRYEERYVITKNGYILTDTREVWSDSLDYYRETGYALLRHNIQIDDGEHKVLSFGDWGEYWDDEGNALLTKDPSMISYDPEQGDSLFMRADTIMMHTRSTMNDRYEAEKAKLEAERAAQLAAEAAAEPEDAESAGEVASSEVPHREDGAVGLPLKSSGLHDSFPEQGTGISGETAEAGAAEDEQGVAEADGETVNAEDGEPAAVTEDAVEGEDSVEQAAEEDPLSGLSKEERKAKLREIAEKEKAEKRRIADEKRAEKAKLRKEKLDAIAERRQAKRTAQLKKYERRDSIAAARSKAREEARRQKVLARLNRKGIKLQWPDSAAMALADSITFAELYFNDSLANALLDSILASWLPDSAVVDSVAEVEDIDTVYRLVRGFRNVRIYRSDFQAVCDSMSSSTLDSVIHMYIEPVLWNGQNQVTSEHTDIHTRNQQLDYAEFVEKPMMISKLDTLHYNQVAGKTMFSYFRDNEIYRDDVNGNAQTIYYMQDDKTGDLQGMMYITSADMTFYIEDQEITGITYRGNPDYVLYPMDKIPESQEYFLQGFTWQEERRPSQDSVFTRSIRPSLRAEKEALARPSFPIAGRIDAFRKRLVDEGRWYDRDEKLTGEVIYWLDMNTDWREQNARDSEMRERQMQGRREERRKSDSDPAADSVAVDAPLLPEPQPKPVTEPAPEPAVIAEPVAEPEFESVPESEPSPAPETEPASDAEAESAPEAAVELQETVGEEADEPASAPDAAFEE